MPAETQVGNREKLLAAAMTCLRERGYAKTTARDLVAASGTNLNSIGYHFGGKEALLNEAIVQGMAMWADEVERAVFEEGPATTTERLRRALAAMVDRFDGLEPFLRAFVEAFPPATRSPELRHQLAAAYQRIRESGANQIARSLADEGQELDEAARQTLASLIIAVCDGLLLQWLLDPERVPRSDAIMDALAAAGRVERAAGRARGAA